MRRYSNDVGQVTDGSPAELQRLGASSLKEVATRASGILVTTSVPFGSGGYGLRSHLAGVFVMRRVKLSGWMFAVPLELISMCWR